MSEMQAAESHIALLGQKREAVEEALLAHVNDACAGENSEVMGLAKQVLMAGGKRWRPILLLLSYKLAGGEDDSEVMPLALSFEMIHTATLVHDDINDGAKFRRNVPTLHERYDSPRALITGDYLFVEGFGLGGGYNQKIVRLIADCCARIASSELMQLKHIGNLATTPEDYYHIISGKTAGPFEAGCKAAAIVAGADTQMVDILGQFGLELGLAFQIVDDLLDLEGDERMGKPRGTDVIEGKMTLPLIHTLTLSHGEDRRRLAEIISHFHDGLWDELTTLLNRSGSLGYARTLVNNHLARAIDALFQFPESESRNALEWLTRQVMERNE
ncbi:MAG: polyprenyl synthetase family protein [Candidatus Thalassarchaeaceae archaeon]|jgi:geranylgeranyl pyrophosphate synthase|nr:polyprenyl synthetase family protein [Candidatus Thalassarchaeaceae archaeon]